MQVLSRSAAEDDLAATAAAAQSITNKSLWPATVAPQY